MFLLYLSLCIIIAAIESPGLIRRRRYREFIFFMFVLLIGFFMGVGFFLKWPLSAPFEALAACFG